MNKFPIRVYSKKELALCYFPESMPENAVRHLIMWVKQNSYLLRQLKSMGYQDRAKAFSPRQVKLITEFLGTPEGYE